MSKRLIRWITYNLLFALLPLVVSLFFHMMTGKLTKEAFANSPELLFFALMVSATAMGDLSEVPAPFNEETMGKLYWSALLIGAVLSAIIYGSFVYDNIINPTTASFRLNLSSFSIWLAVLLFLLSTAVEVWIGRLEKITKAVDNKTETK